jgi:hypothetical protein
MSVAVQEAVVLRQLLGKRAADVDPLDGLALAFFAEVQALLETPWGVATTDFVYPATRGVRPADLEQRFRFSRTITHLAAQHPSIHKLTFEINQLLKPQSALRTLFNAWPALAPGPHDVGSLWR